MVSSWERHQSAFFDARVCNPNAVSYRDLEPQQIYRIHENEKKRLYSERVLDIEHGTFTPLVFTTTGGMGKECLMYHSRLEQLIAIKTRGPVCQNHLMDQNQSKCKYQCITAENHLYSPPIISTKRLWNLAIQRKTLVCGCQAILPRTNKWLNSVRKPTNSLALCAELLGTSKAPKRVVHFIFLSSGAISAMQPKYGRHNPLAY